MGVRKIKNALVKEIVGKSKTEVMAILKEQMPEAKIDYFETGKGIPNFICANVAGFHLCGYFNKNSRRIEWAH